MRTENERLLDILKAIERIERYAAKGKRAFYSDELIQNWMVNLITLHFQNRDADAKRAENADFFFLNQRKHLHLAQVQVSAFFCVPKPLCKVIRWSIIFP